MVCPKINCFAEQEPSHMMCSITTRTFIFSLPHHRFALSLFTGRFLDQKEDPQQTLKTLSGPVVCLHILSLLTLEKLHFKKCHSP